QGYVVDMFDFRLINFAIFNVADIAVTCGGIAFVILYFVKKGEIIKWKR
ncbi:MAG: signal peptidase II, partial [Clostridiales bacterium]|nr:signal peptidase II [Clostridiales bacterium]